MQNVSVVESVAAGAFERKEAEDGQPCPRLSGVCLRYGRRLARPPSRPVSFDACQEQARGDSR